MALSSHASFRKKLMTLTIAGAAMITIAGCYGQPLSTREKGTLAGGAIGAGGGALVGVAVGHPLAGAAIGGVVGAGTGMAIGNSMQNSENRQRYGE
jgi:osmotically inducible lipoprotein OsmB